MNDEKAKFTPPPPRKRIDQYVIEQFPRLSRSYASKLILTEKVLVNGEPVKPGYKLREADHVLIDYDDTALDAIPSIDLPILYEDDDVIVINKPAGVITHARGRYWDEASVASFVRQKTQQEGMRPGIVHRLDRGTSGLIICTKNERALSILMKQFQDRKVQKTYLALVSKMPKNPTAIIDAPIERNPKKPATFRVGPGGKAAQTWYQVLTPGPTATLIELKPVTGRTHQLRVHLAYINCPIIGDGLYGGATAERLMLHAAKLEVTLPSGERRTFEAPMPIEFEELLG